MNLDADGFFILRYALLEVPNVFNRNAATWGNFSETANGFING